MTASSVLTGVVQQSLRNLLPSGLLPVKTDCVGLLDLDDALAPAAGNPKEMLRHLAEAQASARTSGISSVAMGIIEEGAPILFRYVIAGPERTLLRGRSTH
ncbi:MULTISPECIES: hypothetical protein [unclassified Bradyrhizobium]|uniref:hypothetical protein n=1 Tax=unclassified Bradyrhizobium TaxID=2631580 RepID=UPI0015C93083|nr:MULTISPECIES: hypothetical protein [unclassified Bradyrhizobium]MBB4261459.1 hypothetical protein [Bradyrhizobium sp. CIR3A]NYG47709.1 hypothetical protein [Bradyrhizobium sp. IAR9]